MPVGLEPAQLLIIAAVIAVPVVVLAVMWSARSHRRTALRERFGPEYDRTLRTAPNKRTGLKDLEEREQLAQGLALREASTEELSDLRDRIAALQYQFLDDPDAALYDLRPVVDDALAARDYPAHSDRERALRLLSVEDPEATVALRRLDEVTDDRPRTKQEGPVTLDVQREVFLGVRAALRDVAGVTTGGDEPPAALGSRGALQSPPPAPLPAWRDDDTVRAGDRGDAHRPAEDLRDTGERAPYRDDRPLDDRSHDDRPHDDRYLGDRSLDDPSAAESYRADPRRDPPGGSTRA